MTFIIILQIQEFHDTLQNYTKHNILQKANNLKCAIFFLRLFSVTIIIIILVRCFLLFKLHYCKQ